MYIYIPRELLWEEASIFSEDMAKRIACSINSAVRKIRLALMHSGRGYDEAINPRSTCGVHPQNGSKTHEKTRDFSNRTLVLTCLNQRLIYGYFTWIFFSARKTWF